MSEPRIFLQDREPESRVTQCDRSHEVAAFRLIDVDFTGSTGWRWFWRSRGARGKLETGSTAYRALHRTVPSLLGRRLYAVARVS
jgi:hypothetical protein